MKSIIGERKIVKDIDSYFKEGTINEDHIKCCIFHPQSETKLLLDIIMKKMENKIELRYEHRLGEEEITEYFLKNLEFLLKRE